MVSFSCKCEERKKPIKDRKWVVLQRNCHYSAFGGGKKQWSKYSLVGCQCCEAVGRTKAKYVEQLKNGILIV
jgi:hypothetical protein